MKKQCQKCKKEIDVRSTFCRTCAQKDGRAPKRTAAQRAYASEILRAQYADETRDKKAQTRKANKRVAELVRTGMFYAQMYSQRIKRAKRRQLMKVKTGRPSKLENIMRAHLIGHGVEFIEEMALETYNVDFGLPAQKIAIECESGYWHQYGSHKKNDAIKAKLLSEKGWTISINKCPLCTFALKRG